MLSTLPARLSPKGGLVYNDDDLLFAAYHLLCGWRRPDGQYGCGGRLGVLWSEEPESGEMETWRLDFEPGFVVRDSGVWGLSRHASTHQRLVGRLASSRATSPGRCDHAPERLRRGEATAYRRRYSQPLDEIVKQLNPGMMPPRSMKSRWSPLPCRVHCPRCDRVNDCGLELCRQARDRWVQEARDWSRRSS